MAGALNLPFIPTNSIRGSSLEHDNEASFRAIHDPFVGDRMVGTMKPLHPDIAIIHGWAADRCGNAIILPPYGEDIWGAMASRDGVLLTVERLVSTEFIREHSHLVRIPGYLVKSVSLLPFGAHPQPMTNIGLGKSDGYGEDYEFRIAFNEATQNDGLLEKWIQNWVLDCKSHRDYLRKLGYERLLFLKGKTCGDAWQYELEGKLKSISLERKFSLDEIMVIMASRGIKKCVAENGYKTVLAGGGIASLAAWMAVYDLKKEGYDVELLAEAGFFGYTPRPGDPYLFNFNNMLTNKMQSNFIDILGVIGGGNNNKCLAVIGGAQIDRYGNINSTELSDDVLLVGSGGANDIGINAREVIVLIQQSKDRLVDQVSFVTTPGAKVTKFFSTMGIYEKTDNQKEFTLVGLVPDGTRSSIGNKLEEIKKNCGWNLRVSESVYESENPTDEELLTLRLIDPEKQMVR
jgi:acyl CoA:acetate/3-ketoacid CoA transferase beta subunit